MFQFILFLSLVHCLIALQCYRCAKQKGYPTKLFTLLGFIPYFNLVVWVYLLFLPNIMSQSRLSST
ncbi:hypothetical protein [Pseudoalteromonas luteoviolacea]|uniref:Uncharacterized protein n=1 Tax=Pseudoalteromonas luteoviolacea TaxID=43657 RepID=A0A1C0TMN9_9GAMM|nr:hypothetical protein [Pseudoalteromonas luteoviolacea]OCQ20110.1 hypothetical protein A7985_16870 [Pseudoalteromonas luteoviolacea]